MIKSLMEMVNEPQQLRPIYGSQCQHPVDDLDAYFVDRRFDRFDSWEWGTWTRSEWENWGYWWSDEEWEDWGIVEDEIEPSIQTTESQIGSLDFVRSDEIFEVPSDTEELELFLDSLCHGSIESDDEYE